MAAEEEEEEVAFDVVERILVRLDVEDLIRCKSVCKSWQSLISSPYFVKAHLNHSYTSDRDNRQLGHRRIFIRLTVNEEIALFRNKSLCVGSSNGLVCVSPTNAEFVVTNPLTRELKRLQTPPFGSYVGRRIRSVICWGFGYDSSADDYKVIAGFRKRFWERRTRFYVLSLKSNTWKPIGQQVKYRCMDGVEGVLCGGALYWFMCAGNKKVIISLDLSTEEVREIPQPTHEEYDCVADDDHMLGVIEECLCIYEYWSPSAMSYDWGRKWVLKNNKWEIYHDDRCESKFDVAHCVVDSPSHVYVVDDGKHVSSVGPYGRASIFVKSLVSPHPHPHFSIYEGHVKGHGADESVKSGAKGNIRKRKRNKSFCKHKKSLGRR